MLGGALSSKVFTLAWTYSAWPAWNLPYIHVNSSPTALVGSIKLDAKAGSSVYLVLLGSGPRFEDQTEED